MHISIHAYIYTYYLPLLLPQLDHSTPHLYTQPAINLSLSLDLGAMTMKSHHQSHSLLSNPNWVVSKDDNSVSFPPQFSPVDFRYWLMFDLLTAFL